MQFTNIFDENDGSRAVSPVIGVILMVAITVILAAVIGTFVLGLGENVNSTPQVTWDFDAEDQTNDGTIDNITITHNGGDSIEADRLNVTGAVENTNGSQFSLVTDGDFSSGDTVTAGNQIMLNSSNSAITGEEGDVVRIVYTAEDSSSSNVIGTYELAADGAGA